MTQKFLMLLVLLAANGCASHNSFTSFRGAQSNWPTGSTVAARTQEKVPIYHGLPAKPYTVTGISPLPHGPIEETERLAAQLASRHDGEAALILEQDSELASSLRLAAQNPEPASHPVTFKDSYTGFIVENKPRVPSSTIETGTGKLAVIIRWAP